MLNPQRIMHRPFAGKQMGYRFRSSGHPSVFMWVGWVHNPNIAVINTLERPSANSYSLHDRLVLSPNSPFWLRAFNWCDCKGRLPKAEVHDNIRSSQTNKWMGLCINFCPHPTELPNLQHLNQQLQIKPRDSRRIQKDTRTCLPARAPPVIVAGHALAADVVPAGWAPLSLPCLFLLGQDRHWWMCSLLLLISWTLSIPELLVSADKQQH